MAYDEDLANRIRELTAGERAAEKRMFGGMAFLIDGHMAVAASGRGVTTKRQLQSWVSRAVAHAKTLPPK